MKTILPLKTRNFNNLIPLLFFIAAMLLLPLTLSAQAPAVSYTGSHGYITSSPVVPLSPANSGGPVAIAYNGTPQAISFAYAHTQQLGQGVALDNKGNIYVADFANGKQILEYINGQVMQIAVGFNSPKGIAVDKAGNVYWTDRTVIYKMAPGGTPVVIASFTEADSMTIDADGNLYVADQGDFSSNLGGIYKMANDGSNIVKVDNAIQGPSVVAVDSTGNVFAYSALAQSLYKIAAGSGQQTVLNTSFTNLHCLATDRQGNVYVGAEVPNNLSVVNNFFYFISAGSIAAGNVSPQQIQALQPYNVNIIGGITTDAANNLYILYVNTDHLNEVDVYARNGGYSVSPVLPAGLILDNNTGVISGTPAATSAATTYTLTALNSSGSNTANVTIQVGPTPVINYGAGQTYSQKTTISPLTPSNSGAAVTLAGYSTTPAAVATGLSTPAGVTADAAGNIYVTDKTNNTIREITPAGGNPASIGSGFNAPAGIVADAAGNVYVADSGNGAIKEISQGNGAILTLVSGLTAPQYIARDGTGNLFVANSTTIYEIVSGSGTAAMLVTGFSNLTGISVDGNDNLYISGPGKVYKMKVGNNTPLDSGLSFTTPAGVAVDASGNLFITDTNTHALYEVAAGGSSAVTLATGFTSPATVFMDADGKIYISDPGAGKALELSPIGGFYLNRSLPAGLAMDPNTGAISGTPKTQNAAAGYTITAYAGLVSAAASLTISVGPPLGAPVISYQNPPAFLQGAAITPLSPVNTGGTVAAPSWGVPVPFGPNFAQHWGMAVDSKGNVFVCDAAESANKGVIEILANGGATIRYGGSSNDDAVAVDSTGNIYFVHSGALFHATRGNGSVSPFGPQSLSNLVDVAVDPAGNIYVLDFFAQTIHRIAPDGNSETQIGSFANGTNAPFAIAADAYGNVYMGNQGDHTIKEIPAAGGSTITLATGINPMHLAVDNAGNIYEADNSGVVNRVPTGGGALTTIVNSGGYGIAVDGAGNLYSADANGGQIAKVTPAGGYFISRWLPRGLSINNTTGIISGTPTAAAASAAYAITAYNGAGSSSANIILTSGQPPTISYNGPQTYTTGVAITALSPTNLGAAVSAAGYSTSPFVFVGGLGSPQQIASDAAGNIYAADQAKNMVTKISAAGGTGVCIGGGFSKPTGVAVDKAGNVYVADAGNAAVKEIPAAGGFITTIGSGFTAPAAVALDTLGNLYVADVATIFKITPGGVQTSVIAGFNSLSSIAVSPGGKLIYVADSGAGKVYQITTTGSPAYALSIGGNFNSPSGIARDNSGNLFVSDASRQVFEIPRGENTQAISMGLALGAGTAPTGLLVDAAGNIYFSDGGLGQINKVTPQDGYYLNNPLPEGLVLDNTTGTISGTPKAVAAAANYTITAYAGGVSGPAVLNIGVTALQSAPVIKYSLEPTYAAATPIGPLLPTNTGGAVDPTISYNGTPTVMGAGVTPFGRIVYGFNNTIFVADKLDGSIAAIFSDGSVNRQASFLYQPNGIAVDNIGGIWIADNQNVRVLEYGEGSNTFIIAGGSFQVPTSIAADFHGHIFVGDLGLAGVYRMLNDGSNIVKIDNGITHPDALASDAAGNVYAVSSTANALYKIPADGSPQVTVATFTQPTDVTLDPDGNIFVATNDGHIYMILASGGAPFLLRQSTFANISGLTVDPTGVLYVGQSTSPGVSKLILTGSYKANSLPAWLSLNRATGVISGTTPADANEFFCPVSAYNAYGSSTYNVFINTSSSQPSFSYASPTTFYEGIVATLSPQNGSSVYPSAYYQDNLTVLASGFKNPKGVAVDTAGNIYVADQGNNVVKKISPQGGTPVCVGTGFNSPTGIAVDNAGNIYVADSGNGLVKEIPAAGGQILVIGSGFTTPQALAIDQAGNLFVGDAADQAIYKLAASTRTRSLVINTGFTGIAGIAVDADGNLYTADSNPNVAQLIYKLPAGTSSFTPVTGIESINQPGNLTLDPLGNLYFLAGSGQQIFEFIQGNQFYTNLPSGWAGNASGITMDGTGSFIVTSNNSLYKLSPTGGFYINKTLPKGLTFNSNSGVISGTPQSISPATNYKITGYYVGIPGSASVSIKVAAPSTDASLSNLSLSTGFIKHPVFAANVYNYASFVGPGISSDTVIPTCTDANATITVNGSPVASGTASQQISLNAGANLITILVTAQDGTTRKTYTDTLYRALSPNLNLLKLVTDRGVLTPGFSNTTLSYTKAVGYGIGSISFTATTVDAGATVTVGGSPAASGAASAPQVLNYGDNVIDVVVTAQNGTSKTFAITVTRAKSTNDNLFKLTSNHGAVIPTSGDAFSYTKNLNYGFTSISLIPTTVEPNATVTVGGSPTLSGTASVAQPLSVGDNIIPVVVTAQDGITSRTYTVKVTRAAAPLNTAYQAVAVANPSNNLQFAGDNIKVHEGLSPNGDGINDFLLIDGIANYPDNELQIMTRSGQLIFGAKNYDNSTKVFDGHSNKTGAMQLPGTYFYSLDYTVKGEVKHKTGFLVLKY